jgi:N-acetylmuramoyl-L-alanine amidase
VKLRWLVPGLLGSLLLLWASIAEAATLQSWKFERFRNRLEIRTDVGVQPTAKLIFNPVRLVIDLPGTRLGRPKIINTYTGQITALRIAQFDKETTRIVIELGKGYTLDPKEVKFRYSQSAQQWTVELPKLSFSPLVANSEELTEQAIEVPQAPIAVAPSPIFTPRPSPTPSIPVPSAPPSPSPIRPIPRLPVGQPIVVIDPGHGGPDPGAVGIGGLKETDVVLDVSKQVTALLERQGVGVILTRDAEYDLGLEPRVQMANRANATIFVSIHANAISLSRPDINGLETFYFDSGKDLATVIHRTILDDMPEVRDRRVRQARFYVLRRTAMPSVLVETGFVTGAEDAPRLADPGFRSRMAAAIAHGILRYLGRVN